MKRAVLLLVMVPALAGAQEAQLHGFLDARLVAPSAEQGWLEGGYGKTRYGETDDFGPRLGGIVAEGRWHVTPELMAFADVRYDLDDDGRAQLVEAYARWRPVSLSPWRYSVKAGAFFPHVSYENDGIGWTSLWTLTPSAINTWVGEELRTVGAEARLERRGAHTLDAGLAAYQMSDPAGELIAARGWALGDYVYGLYGRVREPDAFAQMLGYAAPRRYDPFQELDDRIGWHADLSWRSPQGRVTLLRYDNNADETTRSEDTEPVYAWHTLFWSLAAETQVGPVTLIAQGMTGETYIDTPFYDSETLFDAGFLLAGWDFAPFRAALRFDSFSTSTEPESASEEHGTAWTAALTWRARECVRLTAEVLHVDSTRNDRAAAGLPERAREWQGQLAARLFF